MTTRAAPPSPNRRRRLPGAAAAVTPGAPAFVRARAAAGIRVQAKKRSLEFFQREVRR